MKTIKTYEDFVNEEINLRKGLMGAALATSLMGGMTSCKKEIIEPNKIELTQNQNQSFISFGGDWKIYKTVQGGGQGVINPNPDYKIKLITKSINSKVDSQIISIDSNEDGVVDIQYNFGEYTTEDGDVIITDDGFQKNGTYKITTEEDPTWGKQPVLEITLDNKSYKFYIGKQENYNNGFQVGGQSSNDYLSVFGVDKSIILKRI
jgi:hypothetical protein